MNFERIDKDGIVFSKQAKNTPVDINAVERCKRVLRHVKKREDISREMSSYNYKHWIEKLYPPYVSKGDFIQAAYDLGFQVEPVSKEDFSSAFFNFTSNDFRLGQIKEDCSEYPSVDDKLKNDLISMFMYSYSSKSSVNVVAVVKFLSMKGWDLTEKDIYSSLDFGKHDDIFKFKWDDKERVSMSIEDIYINAKINLDWVKLKY